MIQYNVMIEQEAQKPEYLYKVVTPEDWKASQETAMIPRGSIDTDFIHLSRKEQLDQIIKKFWDQKEYVVLKIAVNKISGELRFEKNPGGSNKYYHLYFGSIPLKAVEESFYP